MSERKIVDIGPREPWYPKIVPTRGGNYRVFSEFPPKTCARCGHDIIAGELFHPTMQPIHVKCGMTDEERERELQFMRSSKPKPKPRPEPNEYPD